MSVTIAPPMFLQFLNQNNSGSPAIGYQLFTYQAGTSIKQATWTDSTQTAQNANPLPLDGNGVGNFWGDPTLAYKFVWAPANDTDPPTSPIRTVDNLSFPLSLAALTQSVLGSILYPRTPAEIAASVTPTNFAFPPGYLSRYGTNVSPGTTNMSLAILNMLAGNAGGTCYIDSLCLMAGIIINPSSVSWNNAGTVTTINVATNAMNGTQIFSIGTGELLLAPNGGNFNFDTTIWVGIAVQGCDRVLADLRFNGNRANMTSYQGIYCLAICGSTNIYIPSLKCREIRGDALYIDWFSPIHSTGQANSQNIVVDYLYAYNSANDGRQALSVISCAGLTVGQLTSFQIGGTVGGLLMPGGLDLEPDWPAQTISDISIGCVNITTAGGSGIALSGLSISGNDATQDWNIQRVTIGSGRLALTGGGNFLIQRAFDATARVDVLNTSNQALSALIDFANRCNVDLNITNTTIGLWLGKSGFVFDSTIKFNINNYGSTGFGALLTTGVERTTIKGRIFGAASGGGAPAVLLDSNSRSVTQTGVVYSIELPFDANVNLCFENSGVTVGTGTHLLNCDMTGYNIASQCNFQIPSYNCPGRNVGNGLTGAPSGGTWAQFDEVALDQTAGATVPRSKCIAGGTPGTWKPYGVLGA